jgi:ABC-2 type transport system permease protein
MTRGLVRLARLYFIQAWFAYRSLFAWSTPFNYISSKLGFPFFSMLMFIFIGKFVGLNDPIYIVIGNILLLPSLNGIYGISMTVGNERQFGAMTYLLGSPAPRAPLFLGRALFHILDGFITVAVALPIAILVFNLNISQVNLLLLLLCLVLLSFTTTGIGFIMGTISLVSRDGWMYTTTLGLFLYLLIGVNFPVESLPGFMQMMSWGLPMTRGIIAARMVLNGSGWADVSALIGGEILVGLLYIIIGYTLFRLVERASMDTGSLDSI